MNNSDRTTTSAPSAFALARATRALAALPSTSPTVGFIWASVIAKFFGRSVICGWCLAYGQTTIACSDNAYALGDREQPEQPRGDQRHTDRGRTHILDPPDLQVVLGGQAVGQFFDRRVEQFDDQHHNHGRHQ